MYENLQKFDSLNPIPMLSTNHELRFLKIVQDMRNIIQDGRIGKVLHGNCLYTYDSKVSAHHKGATWWNNIELGGGIINTMSPHILDTLRFVTGNEIEIVAAQLNSFDNSDKIGTFSDNIANVLINIINKQQNIPFAISLTTAKGINRKVITFWGSAGYCELDLCQCKLMYSEGDEETRTMYEPDVGISYDSYSISLYNFIKLMNDSFTSNTQLSNIAKYQDGLVVLEMIDAIRKQSKCSPITDQ